MTKEEENILLDKIKKSIDYRNFAKLSVLGIDILDYSQFPEPQQIFIPKVLDILLENAFEDIKVFENYLFQKEIATNNIKESFIDQGDGGFFILDTPLHSIILSLYIESALRKFNSFNLIPKLRSIVGPLKLRYSITYDTLYKYAAKWTGENDKYYGSAIIHCARIMSKDKLDRCLIDENTYIWFTEKFQGIESLKITPFEYFSNLFPEYKNSITTDDGKDEKLSSFAFLSKTSKKQYPINAIDILKIGQIQVKKDKLNIYSVHIQMSFSFNLDIANDNGWKYFMITLGNLNPEGLASV